MGENSFRHFLDSYLDIWRNSSLSDMKRIISKDYKAREISAGEVIDFGYEQSIAGWEQGFDFVKREGNSWNLNEVSIIPLRQDEMMAILSATLVIDGKKLENVSYFFRHLKNKKMRIGH
ncbi:flavoprotein [Solibacillus sp. FSL W8-0474]|uniref:flavoprotein n=1 Tax=Solibacillus sp. FSL W8-0474 TaxID=2975336 RepID=UPI0030FD17AB